MKTIVYINGKKHSAWNSKKDAKKQINVLQDYGYKNCHFEYIEHNYDNGHYFY